MGKATILGTNFLKSNKGSQQCKSLYEVTLFKDYDGSYLNFIFDYKNSPKLCYRENLKGTTIFKEYNEETTV